MPADKSSLPASPADAPAPPYDAPPADIIAPARERTIQALTAHFAGDVIDVDEFESRLERAYRATVPAQLDALVADLPAIQGFTTTVLAPYPFLAPTSEVPERGVLIAVMGGHGRGGSWLVPRHLKVFAVMGGAGLDLREARFAPGVTEIDVTAIMGGAEIIVPPGVRVECVGSAFMGGFEVTGGDVSVLGPANPILRIDGTVVMGGVEIKTARPGEKLDDD
jgi:hypothetical protein